jgi:hypothetical protein
MSNNKNYYSIFEQDGKATQKKPPQKRIRQETPSPPASVASAHSPAPLAIEAPPPRDDTAITSRLDEIELTMRKYLIRIVAMERYLEDTHEASDTVANQLDKNTTCLAGVIESLNMMGDAYNALVTKLDALRKPAPVAASDPQLVAAIAALSKKVDGLLERPALPPPPLHPVLPPSKLRPLPHCPRRSTAFSIALPPPPCPLLRLLSRSTSLR